MRVPAIRAPFAALATAACLLLAAPAQAQERTRPIWTERPKSDDSVYTYFVGYAEGRESQAAARQAALEDAANRMLDDLMMRSGLDSADRAGLKSRLGVSGMEPIPDAEHHESSSHGDTCWIMVSFPITEREKLVKTIGAMKQELIAKREALIAEREAQQALDARLNEAFRKAKAAALAGDAGNALALLREPVEQYGSMAQPEFQIEEAQMLAGDLNRDRNEALAARAIYEVVSGTSTSEVWKQQASERAASLPKPPRFWPLRMRLGGGPIALLFASQTDGGTPTEFQSLRNVVLRDLQECRVSEADIGPLTPGRLDGFFSRNQIEEMCGAAVAGGAKVLLVAICRLNSSLKGKTQDVMGVAMPLPDSVVEIRVIDTARKVAVYTDQFKEMTGSQSQTKTAERITSIMINKYLIPKCPAIASPATP